MIPVDWNRKGEYKMACEYYRESCVNCPDVYWTDTVGHECGCPCIGCCGCLRTEHEDD